MSVYRLLATRYLLLRWDRGAMMVASIALGVATLVSALILNQCIEAAAQDTTTPAGHADLFATNGEAGVLHTLADELRAARIPGVKSIQPLVYERVFLPDLDGRAAVLIGAEVSTQLLPTDNTFKVTVELIPQPALWPLAPIVQAIQAGDFRTAGQLWDRLPVRLVMISRPIHDEWQRRTGGQKSFRIRHATCDMECIPVAIVDFAADSPLAPMGKNFLGMSLGQAIQVVRPTPPLVALGGGVGEVAATILFPPKVNRIDLFLEPDADTDAVVAAAEQIAHGRAEIRTPNMQRRSTQEVVSGLQIGVLMCSLGAMIVGLFLVYNAMAVTVTERRADIGILRSLGATRAQVIVLFGFMAGILGAVGALGGVPLGILLAEFTLSQFRTELESMFLNPEVNPARLSVSQTLWAIAAGVATAVLAALIPAIQAATDDPAHVVRRSASAAKGLWKLLHRSVCVLMVTSGTALILLRDQMPPRVGGVGGMMTVLVGLLLASPMFVSLFVTIFQPLVHTAFPFTLRLAFDNLSRAPGRTGVVIGALGAGVALMFQTAGVGRSNEEPVVSWIAQVVQADHFVFSGNMTTANSSNSPMSPTVARDLKALPGVEDVMAIRYARPEFNGTIVYLVALDVVAYAETARTRVPETAVNLQRFPELADDHPDHTGITKVMVSENFLARHGKKVGDIIRLAGPQGPVDLLIIGAARDYSWSRGTIFIDRTRYARLFRDELIDICHVFLAPEASGPTQALLEAYTHEKGLFLTDRDALRQFLSELINRVYLLAYMQQIVVAIVAALGVVTALLISVLQRKRELGLLLAVGATPRQVLASVLAEAFLMGIFGTALGILIGLPMEWYVLKVMFVDESGFDMELLIPWKETLAIAGTSISLATLAGLIPAWRAIQTRIPDALQYE